MKYLILILLFSVNAFAGEANLTWETRSYLEDSPMTETNFRIIWGVEGQALENQIDYGPPARNPDSFIDGLAKWHETIDNPSWLPGLRICFQLIVLVSDNEVVRSNSACKTMHGPNSPVLVNVEF